MKLSQAIREGSKLRPQAFGYYYHLQGGRICSCAIGAAYEAASLFNPEQLKMPCELPDEISFFEGIPKDWVTTMPKLACPAFCNDKHSLPALVTHLNDNHYWKRERIADYVEGIGY